MTNMKTTKSKLRNRTSRFSTIDRQQGWTLWSLMFVAGVLMLFSYVGLQLVPVYSANKSVTSAMQLALDNLSPNNVSRADVIRTMKRKLNVDSQNDLLDYKTDLEVKRTQREIIINVNYERRVSLFFNLSLVATFENELKRAL